MDTILGWVLKTDAQLSYYLNNVFYHTIVKHPNPKSLSQLTDLGANPTVGPEETPYLLTMLKSHTAKPVSKRVTELDFSTREEEVDS